ncbi:MAG: retroviral-like aspartic protease family protein [Chloroflexota bacterium]
MKFEYDQKIDPAAPFLPARLGNLESPPRYGDFRAKVDTGADMTVIPEAAVKALNLTVTDRLEVAGFDNRPTIVDVYALQIELPNGKRGKLKAFAFDEEYVLLGRDAINHLRLLFDGPALTLEILE